MSWGLVTFLALLIFGTLGVAWSLLATIRFAGRWRYLAGVPLVVLVVYGARIALEVERDPSSHNLLPFELAVVAAPSFLYMAALAVIRLLWLRRRGSAARDPVDG